MDVPPGGPAKVGTPEESPGSLIAGNTSPLPVLGGFQPFVISNRPHGSVSVTQSSNKCANSSGHAARIQTCRTRKPFLEVKNHLYLVFKENNTIIPERKNNLCRPQGLRSKPRHPPGICSHLLIANLVLIVHIRRFNHSSDRPMRP